MVVVGYLQASNAGACSRLDWPDFDENYDCVSPLSSAHTQVTRKLMRDLAPRFGLGRPPDDEIMPPKLT